MQKFTHSKFFPKLRIHLVALILFAFLALGIALCYFSGENVVQLETDKWNMDAISFVH